MAEYRTAAGFAEGEFTEKKSRFIGQIAPVSTEEAAAAFIAEIRARHREARHNVFAWALRDGKKRASDDGEPQGTGGVPVLGALEGSGLVDVCVVVTRYFGGVLLGVGGLSRAYGHGAKLALEAAAVRTMAQSADYALSVPYELYGKFEHWLPDAGARVLESGFGAEVSLSVRLREEDAPAFLDGVRELTSASVAPRLIKTGWDELD